MAKKASPRRVTLKAPSLASLNKRLLSLETRAGELPSDLQMRVDVHVALLDAMTDAFPIAREDITNSLVPSKDPIRADVEGWGICLAGFAECLVKIRPIYAIYGHRRQYTSATLNKPIEAIISFLAKQVIDQLSGG